MWCVIVNSKINIHCIIFVFEYEYDKYDYNMKIMNPFLTQSHIIFFYQDSDWLPP